MAKNEEKQFSKNLSSFLFSPLLCVLLVLGRMAVDNDDGRWCRIYEERGGRTVGWEVSKGSLRTSGRFLCDSSGEGHTCFWSFWLEFGG